MSKKVVIYPKDPGTEFLKVLFPEDSEVFGPQSSSSLLRHKIMEADEIYFLGHGDAKHGLLSLRYNREMFGPSRVYILRQKTKVFGMWCYASDYAKKYRLHGLFSGMYISDLSEALEWGITEVTQEDITRENELIVKDLKDLLTGGCPWEDIPEELVLLDKTDSQLSIFNRASFTYFP